MRADDVEAFLDDIRLVRLPLCPGPVAGLCTYRGGLLPVIDVGGGDADSVALQQAVLGLRTARGLLGLLVSRGEVAIVEEGRAAGEGDCTVVEGGAAALPEGLVATKSIARGGEVYPLLDPGRTWAAVRDLILRRYVAGCGVPSPDTGSSGV